MKTVTIATRLCAAADTVSVDVTERASGDGGATRARQAGARAAPPGSQRRGRDGGDGQSRAWFGTSVADDRRRRGQPPAHGGVRVEHVRDVFDKRGGGDTVRGVEGHRNLAGKLPKGDVLGRG